LYFEAQQVPYVVKNPVYGKENGGPVKREVPWRDATRVRSANHSDLILLLSPLQRPALKIEVGKGRGFVNHYPMMAIEKGDTHHHSIRMAEGYYLRVKVLNTGRRTAERCRGYLANVEQWANGSFQPTLYADFMPLTWSHNPGRESMELLPQVPHWLDVLSTLNGRTTFILESNPKSPKYTGCDWGNGIYRFTIRVYAEEAEPSQDFVFLNWTGHWDNLLDVFDKAEWERRTSAGTIP
jgi:hypothetical protein